MKLWKEKRLGSSTFQLILPKASIFLTLTVVVDEDTKGPSKECKIQCFFPLPVASNAISLPSKVLTIIKELLKDKDENTLNDFQTFKAK